MSEPTPEEIADASRMGGIYNRLSSKDLFYIVSRWDEEQGLEPTFERLNYRDGSGYRRKRRRTLIAAAVVPVLFAVWWIGNLSQTNNDRAFDSYVLDYIREHYKGDMAVQAAIQAAERDYQEYLDQLKADRDAGE